MEPKGRAMAGKAVESSHTSIIEPRFAQTPGLDQGSRAVTPSGWLARTMAKGASRQMAARGNIVRGTKHSNHSCPVEIASPHRWKNPSTPTWMH